MHLALIWARQKHQTGCLFSRLTVISKLCCFLPLAFLPAAAAPGALPSDYSINIEGVCPVMGPVCWQNARNLGFLLLLSDDGGVPAQTDCRLCLLLRLNEGVMMMS